MPYILCEGMLRYLRAKGKQWETHGACMDLYAIGMSLTVLPLMLLTLIIWSGIEWLISIFY